MKYGIVLGRMQPFHKGHQEIINEILLDGRIPIIILGTSNPDRDLIKNPLTFAQRQQLIRLVFPNIDIMFIPNEDNISWDTWYYTIITALQDKFNLERGVADISKQDIVMYYHNKEEDRTSFFFHSKNYTNTFYTDVFQNTFPMVKVKFPVQQDFTIKANARDIRADLEGKRYFLDARVYNQLKEWGW